MEAAAYKAGDIANGHILGEDNQWHPIPQPSTPVAQKYFATRAQKFYAALAVGALAFLGIGFAISTIGSETVTIHGDAVDIAGACYDDEDGSDGTTLPGTKDFDYCVYGVADMMKSSYIHSDTEIVDSSGNPVSYSSYSLAVRRDVDSFATKDWRP